MVSCVNIDYILFNHWRYESFLLYNILGQDRRNYVDNVSSLPDRCPAFPPPPHTLSTHQRWKAIYKAPFHNSWSRKTWSCIAITGSSGQNQKLRCSCSDLWNSSLLRKKWGFKALVPVPLSGIHCASKKNNYAML